MSTGGEKRDGMEPHMDKVIEGEPIRTLAPKGAGESRIRYAPMVQSRGHAEHCSWFVPWPEQVRHGKL